MPTERPPVAEIQELFEKNNFFPHCQDIPLNLSQTTALSRYDQSAILAGGELKEAHEIPNDATNACAFLCLLISDRLYRDEDSVWSEDCWKKTTSVVEEIIITSPGSFNRLRDVSKFYDPLGAYQLLRKGGLISNYTLTEEMGEYRLAPEFQAFSVSPFDWSQKTPEQQRQHVEKVLKVPLSSPSTSEVQATTKLSILVEDCGVTSVAAGFLNQIWHQAEVILSHYKVIDLGGGAYCVTEFGNSVNVTVKGNNPTRRCKNFQSTAGLCAHILAVAETIETLSSFVENFNKKKGKSNSTVHATFQKGQVKNRKKKRGEKD